MKRVIIFSALALLVGGVLVRLLQYDAGYVLIVVAGKSVEMRFWVAVVALILLIWAAIRSVRLIKGLLYFLTDGWRSFRHDRFFRTEHRIQSGLLHLLEGDYKSADSLLGKAVKRAPGNIVALVGASEAAIKLKKYSEAEQRLKLADGIRGDKAVSLALADIRLVIAKGELKEAHARLLVLKTRAPNHPVVLQLLQKVLVELREWAALEALLSELDRNDVLSESRWFELQKLTYRELLLSTAEASDPLIALEATWLKVPKTLKKNPLILAVYCRLMIYLGQTDEVEPVLLHALKTHWDAELVELFGLLPSSAPEKQLKSAEKWLESHPEDSGLLLALGRICMRNQLWGQAREYFRACIALASLPVAYAELARLLASLGDVEQSTALYRQGLLNLAPNLPPLPLPADVAKTLS